MGDRIRRDGELDERAQRKAVERRVLETLRAHAPTLLQVALRYTGCGHEAQDAYQRTVEIYLKRVWTLEPERDHLWLHAVIKNEALAVRAARAKLEVMPDRVFEQLRDQRPSPEEQSFAFEQLHDAAEALARCKPAEATALVLHAEGMTYAQISEHEQWSETKVNRLLREGRRRFVRSLDDIASGAECARLEPMLSALIDGQATAAQLKQLQPHLRRCRGCQETVRALHRTQTSVAALLPIGVVLGAPADPAVSTLTRSVEGIGSALDRLLLWGHKLPVAVDVLASGKVAVVAASAAAVAGTGALIADQVPTRPVPHPARVVAAGPAPTLHASRTAEDSPRLPAMHVPAHRHHRTPRHPKARPAGPVRTVAVRAPVQAPPSHVAPAARPVRVTTAPQLKVQTVSKPVAVRRTVPAATGAAQEFGSKAPARPEFGKTRATAASTGSEFSAR